MSHLGNLKADFLFLHEAHRIESEAEKLKGWLGDCICSNYSAKSKRVEVSILFHKKLSTQILSADTDMEGRFVIVKVKVIVKVLNSLNKLVLVP